MEATLESESNQTRGLARFKNTREQGFEREKIKED
jgi:hypothetical protein